MRNTDLHDRYLVSNNVVKSRDNVVRTHLLRYLQSQVFKPRKVEQKM